MLHSIKHDSILQMLFDKGVAAVKTDQAVYRNLNLEDDYLHIGDSHIDLGLFERIHIVGGGKGAAPMAIALENMLGDRISGGDIVVKTGHAQELSYVRCWEASHPVPDMHGVEATHAIIRRLENCTQKDLVICCITGGSSALMIAPVAPLDLSHKQKISETLLGCGATIHEINTIRKHTSAVKGGRLAEIALPSTVISLIVSDVIGDDLSVIGSGPTVLDSSTFSDCLRIIESYDIAKQLPDDVMQHLAEGSLGRRSETPKSAQSLSHVSNHLIATNKLAIEATCLAAAELDFDVEILSSAIEGEARDVAKILADQAKAKRLDSLLKPLLLVAGGETTVHINGKGKGGRNQELALAMAIELSGTEGIYVLCAGTDGSDGPTDAAGAFACGKTVQHGNTVGLSAISYLQDNDSYHFFKAIDSLSITGPTLTNVMDMTLILIEPRKHRSGPFSTN